MLPPGAPLMTTRASDSINHTETKRTMPDADFSRGNKENIYRIGEALISSSSQMPSIETQLSMLQYLLDQIANTQTLLITKTLTAQAAEEKSLIEIRRQIKSLEKENAPLSARADSPTFSLRGK
jgi:hypothetical protein